MERGQVVGIVGESGSGKSTLGRAILGVQPATEGRVWFDGKDIALLSRTEQRRLRGRVQLMPQDAMASLSPRFTVRRLLDEVQVLRQTPVRQQRSVEELLEMVELGPEHADKYPHELSGGQARRVSIARALAMEPDLIVADEVIAGLDVSAVAAVVNLLLRLRNEFDLSYLFITHDLDVVAYIADVIGVLYLGQMVELGRATDVIDRPKHPYTRALLSIGSRRKGAPRWRIEGEPPSPANPPSGCRFRTRCPFVRPLCAEKEPMRERCGDHDHLAACHFWREIAESQEGEVLPTT